MRKSTKRLTKKSLQDKLDKKFDIQSSWKIQNHNLLIMRRTYQERKKWMMMSKEKEICIIYMCPPNDPCNVKFDIKDVAIMSA